MALISSNSVKLGVKKESTFKEILTYVDADLINFTSASFTPSTDNIERDYVNSTTLLKGKPLQGAASTSGTVSLEVIPDATDTTMFAGHTLYEAAFGKYEAAGAVITGAVIEDHTAANDGDSGIYYIDNTSLYSFGLKYIMGAEATSVDIRGNVVNSLKLNFPSQAIVTAEFGIDGSTGFVPVAQGSELAEPCSSKIPVVARGMVVLQNGSAICATDLSIDLATTLADFTCVTDTGPSNKSLTERAITGTVKLAFEDLGELNAFNAASDFSIFLQATSLDGNVMAVYIPQATRTDLSIDDDNGTLVQNINFTVSAACDSGTTKPIMVAIK